MDSFCANQSVCILHICFKSQHTHTHTHLKHEVALNFFTCSLKVGFTFCQCSLRVNECHWRAGNKLVHVCFCTLHYFHGPDNEKVYPDYSLVSELIRNIDGNKAEGFVWNICQMFAPLILKAFQQTHQAETCRTASLNKDSFIFFAFNQRLVVCTLSSVDTVRNGVTIIFCTSLYGVCWFTMINTARVRAERSGIAWWSNGHLHPLGILWTTLWPCGLLECNYCVVSFGGQQQQQACLRIEAEAGCKWLQSASYLRVLSLTVSVMAPWRDKDRSMGCDSAETLQGSR